MAAYDEDVLRDALTATIEAGTFAAKPIRVVAEGDQRLAGPGIVAMMPPIPIVGVDEGPAEAWVIWRSVWALNLYVPLSAKATAFAAHRALGALTLAVFDAVSDDVRLGGAAKGVRPSAEPSEARTYAIGEKKFLTRTIEFAIFT